MLRNSGDTNLQQFLGSISIDSNPKSCSQKVKDKFKKPCGEAQSDLDKLWNMRKNTSCRVHHCLPMKLCRAKIAFSANGEEVVDNQYQGLNLTPSLNVGGNQLGYVYRETQIVDTDRFLDALRNNNPLSQNVVTKIAEQNHNLFNVPYHSIDGANTGNPITNECPKKTKPCPKPSRCKKPDPMLYHLGIGSDGFESRDSLRDVIEAGRAIKASENVVEPNLINLENDAEPNNYLEGEEQGEVTPLQQTQMTLRGLEPMEMAEYLLQQAGSSPADFLTLTNAQADEVRRRVSEILTGVRLTAQQQQAIMREGSAPVQQELLADFYQAGGTRPRARSVFQAIDRIRPRQAGGRRKKKQ